MSGQTVTLEYMYTVAGVDESSSAKLAEQADANIEAAADLTTAEEKKHAFVTASASLTEDEKTKVSVLAAAAVAGVEVKKLSAADAATACVDAFASRKPTADKIFAALPPTRRL